MPSLNPLRSAAFRKALRMAAAKVTRSSSLARLAAVAIAALRRTGPALGGVRGDAAALGRMLRDWATHRYRDVPRRTLVAAAAGLIYFLNPLDMLPDFLPVLGLADDAAVLAWIIHQVRRDLDAYRAWESGWGSAIDIEGFAVSEDEAQAPPPASLPG